MNYISLLNKEEKLILCNIISGRIFKALFQKNSKDFAKIKPGFRTNSLSESDAVSLAVRFIDKPFISSFINTTVRDWIDEIQKYYDKLRSMDLDEDHAIAEALYESVFSEHIELYFTLIQEETKESYIETIKSFAAQKQYQDGKASATEIASVVASSDGEDELKEQISKYTDQIRLMQEKQDMLERSLADAQQAFQALQREKQENDAELNDLRARVQYDDASEIEMVSSNTGDDYVSLCEVLAPDYAGQRFLLRLADIGRNGNLEVFYLNEDMPKVFGNRSKLFFRDGPTEPGEIGVWNWSAIPNITDPSRDYVTSNYNHSINPIEVIIINDCKSAKELLGQLKTGVKATFTTSQIMFSAYLSKGQYVGFLCRRQDVDENGNIVKLSQNVISLPQYNFSGQDVTRMTNNRVFFRLISIDNIQTKKVSVKNPLDIVKTIILNRNSWQTLKQKGKTRSEWRIIRDFLEGLETTSIIEDIVKAVNCSNSEAQKVLDEFISHADSYIDGNTIEDGIVSAVITANPELMSRCKELIKEDWLLENEAAVSEATKAKAELDKQVEAAKAQLDIQRKAADVELEATKTKCEKLKESIDILTKNISDKEQFAADVETAVKKRIQQAQADVADFIAGLSFVPNMTVSQSSVSNIPETENASQMGAGVGFISGTALNPDNLEEISTLNEALDVISDELSDAGVTPKYSRPLAAYMYSAYLNNVPLLMVGPNGNAIVDAFSGAISGKTAGVLDCNEKYSQKIIEECLSSDDKIIRIVNPFGSEWIHKIPDIIDGRSSYFIAVYPYSEDIQIEPKSLYNYMLPIFTELFVETVPSGTLLGGQISETYKEFQVVKALESHHKLLSAMHTSPLVKTRIQALLDNMHIMLDDQNVDYDVLFALMPYANATMQMPVILDAIQSGHKRVLPVSNDLADLVKTMYGENE